MSAAVPMLDAVSYKNGPKNNWRRTMWNIVANEIPDRHDAIVLYLPGATDLDRPEAIRRGLKPANLIAIECNPKVVRALRAQHTTVIPGDLNHVIENWPEDRHVGAVIADFQRGFDDYTSRFVELVLKHPAFDDTSVLINLQRGRDVPLFTGSIGYINDFRSSTAATPIHGKSRVMSVSLWIEAIMEEDRLASNLDIEKREAEIRARAARNNEREASIPTSPALELAEKLMQRGGRTHRNHRAGDLAEIKEILAKYDRSGAEAISREIAAEAHAIAVLSTQNACLANNRLRNISCIPLPAYRSSRVFFDSAVWRVKSFLPRAPLRASPKMRQKIAAALAIRTMRLRGELQ